MRIPPDISEWELGVSFTFTPYDLKIINQHRRDHNRLGFAVQLCVLLYTGWPLNEVKIGTKDIHPNRLRQLSRIGVRYEPYALRRFDKQKRYAMLIAYLLDTQNLVGQAFEIHDRQICDIQSKGRKAQEEIQKKNGKSINEKVIHFASLGKALIKARNEGIDPFVALETVMPWDSLVAAVAEAEQLSRPIDYDYLDLLDGQYNRLRRYTPFLLSTLEFRFTKSTEPLMQALDVIREMNATGRRKVSDDAPLDFIPKQWRNHEEAMNRAQATLVNFRHKLRMFAWWGDGTTSSSDGMGMQIGVSAYTQTQTHIMDLAKTRQSIVSQAINFQLSIRW